MNHFDYRDGVLHAEDVAIPAIAAAVGTPFYCYSTATLTRHYRVFSEAFADLDALVCYAMKANSNQAVIRTLARLGAGADVVSEGELRRALAAGVQPSKILFSGVGKTAREMDFALAAGIHCFNVESEPELEMLSARAVAAGAVAPVSLRINPDVDAKTHRKISTGKAENKFDMIVGVDINPGREAMARKFGMTHFVNPKDVEGDLVPYLVSLTKGGADYTFECIGNTQVMRQALECAHKGWGTSVIIGVAPAGAEISTRPFQLVTGRNWRGSAFGGARGRTDVPKIVDWYMDGKIDIDSLITHTMPLEKINDAFDLMHRGESIRSVVVY